MTYERLKDLKPSAFKRRCGVQRETFSKMVNALRSHLDRSGGIIVTSPVARYSRTQYSPLKNFSHFVRALPQPSPELWAAIEFDCCNR